jgi:hypothetical protein
MVVEHGGAFASAYDSDACCARWVFLPPASQPGLFNPTPVVGTKQDDFEQVVRFTLSSQYEVTQNLVGRMVATMAFELLHS